MKVVHKPRGGESRTYQLDTLRMRASEGETVEAAWRGFGDPPTLAGWRQGLLSGSARATRIALWWVLRKTAPTLKLKDVDPEIGEVEIDLGVQELSAIRNGVADVKAKTDEEKEEKEEKLKLLDEQIEIAIAEEEAISGYRPVDPPMAQ